MDTIPESPSPNITNFSDLKVNLSAKDESVVTQSPVVHNHILLRLSSKAQFVCVCVCKSLFTYFFSYCWFLALNFVITFELSGFSMLFLT